MRDPQSMERINRLSRLEKAEERVVMSAAPIAQPMLDYLVETQAYLDLQSTALAQAHQMTGLTQARANYGLEGRGQTVAVIDTGIGFDHYALGGGFGTGFRVVGGADFAEGDANPYDDGPYGSHGTHVAGIVGSTDATNQGVAPGVDLVALRVFDDAGKSDFAWVEQALQWVHDHRNDFANPITTINLSLGVAWNSDTVPNWTTLEDNFAQLEADGIFIAVAAGNSFGQYNAPGLAYPASSSFVVPVASVDEAGGISDFSQRNSRVIAAPGRSITSTVPDYRGNFNGIQDDFVTYSGTSMATPYVAGASVLIREAYAFAGNTNVSQDLIYDLMRNTADTVYDPATGQNYFRLNLGRALDTVMPTDEFGSTIATGHQFGSLAGSSSISGAIAKIGDVDSFSFTASSSGRVTFSLTPSGKLTPSWSVQGATGTVSGDRGQVLSFDVVGGQNYTVSLGSSGGLGRYSLSVNLAATAAAKPAIGDLGKIDFKISSQQLTGGVQIFAATATRQGVLTFEAFFAQAGGNVDLAVFDAHGRQVGTAFSTNDYERIDVAAQTGETFFLRTTGSNAQVYFRMTNLLTQNASSFDFAGTSASDSFQFTAGATSHTASINGVQYVFSSSVIRTVNFYGGAGADHAALTGSAGTDYAALRAGSGELAGSGYLAQVGSAESIYVLGSEGADVASLYDSAGNDAFASYGGLVEMATAGMYIAARGFEQATAYSTSGGVDAAVLCDSAGSDTLTARPDSTRLTYAGSDVTANAFDTVTVYGSTGMDQAALYDSAGNDTFSASPTFGQLTGAGYAIKVHNFDKVRAYASGGTDTALLYDSAGNDTLVSRPTYTRLYNAAYDLYAQGFDSAQAYGSTGADLAYLYDSTGNDVLTLSAGRVLLAGSGFSLQSSNFRTVQVYASGGTDRASFQTTTSDSFTRETTQARLRGAAFDYYALSFEQVDAAPAPASTGGAELQALDNFFGQMGRNG